MPFDLGNFSLDDMLRCGAEIRRATAGAASMSEAAAGIVDHLYRNAVDSRTGERCCALVRFYKTHPFGFREPDAQNVARRLLGSTPPAPDMKCLTLLATAGDEPAWRSPGRSVRHRAIPLASAEIVAQAPMIAQLIEEFGLDVADVVTPAPELSLQAPGRSYNVFHVEEARGSPYIPAQEDLVLPYRIRSVLGFGGLLWTGELFATIMFSRVPIPAASANRFRTVALDVKSALFRFRQDQVFAQLV